MTPELRKKLRYGSQFHEKILSAVRERYKLADNRYSSRVEEWRKDEETFMAYMPETEADRLRSEKRRAGTPQQTTLVLPYSYAIAMTMHTYLSNVFLSRDPIFQYEGNDGKASMNRPAVEALIAYQMRKSENTARLYLWLMDLCKYGVAYNGVFWDRQVVTLRQEVEQPVTFFGVEVGDKTKRVTETREVLKYEGNALYNIRPYNVYTDPRVSLVDYQKGEFVIEITDDYAILDLQAHAEDWANVDVAVRMSKGSDSGLQQEMGSEVLDMPDTSTQTSLPLDVKMVGTGQLKQMHIRLIPQEWGLADGRSIEKWTMTTWNDRVVVDVSPRGEAHDRFPGALQTYEIDAYQSGMRSISQILRPMQELLDWLVNTHMFSIRRVLNDQILVDPSLVVMKDVTDPNAGKIIRAKPAAYGAGMLDKAVQQLKVSDVTQTHMGDLGLVVEMMQRATGVTDQIMGQMAQGGRRTAQEVRTNAAFGVNRLKTVAEWGSAHAWNPLASMMLQNSQQYLSAEQTLRIVGDNVNVKGADSFLNVTLDDLVGDFDFVEIDGTLPIDRFAQANMWRDMLGTAAQVPGVLAQYDMGGIFAWIAQLAGMKGVKQFRLQLTDDQILREQLQAGNVVSLDQAKGAGVSNGGEGEVFSSGQPGGDAGVGVASQLSGLGTSG